MVRVWFLSLLLLLGCEVPVQPNAEALAERARAGDAKAAAALLQTLDELTPQDERSLRYSVLLEVGHSIEKVIMDACGPGDGDAVRREHALALAANLRLEGAGKAALEALADTDFSRRYVAAWALGELGDAAAVPALLVALEEGSSPLARTTARALVKLGAGAVPFVLGALPRLTPAAAAYAVRVLGESGDPRAAEALTQALALPVLRADAAWALGKLGLPRLGTHLLPYLEDTDWRVRLEVVRAVGVLELAAADGQLERMRTADTEQVVREWAARSLALIRAEPQVYLNGKGEMVLPSNLYR